MFDRHGEQQQHAILLDFERQVLAEMARVELLQVWEELTVSERQGNEQAFSEAIVFDNTR